MDINSDPLAPQTPTIPQTSTAWKNHRQSGSQSYWRTSQLSLNMRTLLISQRDFHLWKNLITDSKPIQRKLFPPCRESPSTRTIRNPLLRECFWPKETVEYSLSKTIQRPLGLVLLPRGSQLAKRCSSANLQPPTSKLGIIMIGDFEPVAPPPFMLRK